jgi:GxxExxY protein
LKSQGIVVEREINMPIIYKQIKIEHGYRIDILVENRLVVELKIVEKFTDVHLAQILTYKRLGEFSTGLLINFNTKLLKDGIKRVRI